MSGERVKLTKARWATLEAISKGQVFNVRYGYGAWRIRGAPPSVVGALIQTLRLAAWAPSEGADCKECVCSPPPVVLPSLRRLTMSRERVRRTAQTITIGGRGYMKFIPPGQPVRDGTVRCIFCGQIDEPAYHDDALCRRSRKGRP